MSLRTRLILAFLLLSVVPLSAVTLYSYSTSVQAFQRAVEREAAQSASDISHRIAMVTDDLGRRMDQLFDTPDAFPMNGDESTMAEQQVRARLPMLGDVAALVDRVEFDPMPTVPGVAPVQGAQKGAVVPPAPGAPGVPPPPPVAPAPPARSSTSIVVDVGSILEATRKGIEATGILPPEAQAQMNKEMAKAIRESVEANITKTEAMKAAAAAMSTPK